jgi:acyl-CoA thioesterase-1
MLLGLIPAVAQSDQAVNTEIPLPKSNKSLLVLGDSLSAAYGLLQSEGWVSLLEKQWQDGNYGIDVINAAISGDTTDGGLARLPRLLEQHQPTHVLIELGGNDGLRGGNINKMRENLNKMIALAKNTGAEVLLQDIEIPTNYGRRYTKMFSDSYELLAEENDVVYVPFFLNDIALDKTLMQQDGIHPNKTAQPLIASFMYTQLTPHIVAD